MLLKLSKNCDDTPSAHTNTSTSSNYFDPGRWSTSGSDRSIAHFFMGTRDTIKGVGGKRTNEKTNNMFELTQVQEEELSNIAFPMCICRLTLAWISCENSATHEECWLILTALPSLTLGPSLMPTGHFCCPVSTGQLRYHSPTAFFSVLLSNSYSRSLTHFRSSRYRGLRPLFSFAPKQTKGSSAWRTTDIVLQNYWNTKIQLEKDHFNEFNMRTIDKLKTLIMSNTYTLINSESEWGWHPNRTIRIKPNVDTKKIARWA